jgi:hypothetical protein
LTQIKASLVSKSGPFSAERIHGLISAGLPQWAPALVRLLNDAEVGVTLNGLGRRPMFGARWLTAAIPEPL